MYSEFDIEGTVCTYAEKERDCLVLKLNVLGRVGWPDRIFIYHKKVMFIEFKREGERPRKIQDYVHDQIRAHGIPVYVVDNISSGKAIIDHFTKSSENI